MIKHLNSSFVIRHSSLYRYLRFMLSIMFFFLSAAGYSNAQTWYTVKWVNDGDTIVLTNGWRVRYIGTDAPEIDHENQKAQPYGYKARSFNKKWKNRTRFSTKWDAFHAGYAPAKKCIKEFWSYK